MTDHPLHAKHRDTLARAVAATRDRGYWSPYPESPSPTVYGEPAADAGRAAFESYLGQDFPLDTPGRNGTVTEERSPYGIPLLIRYPHVDLDTLLGAMAAAMPAWRDAGPHARAGVCLEVLARLNAHSFEIAHAVMHTTGQAFVMAFQAGGPHAQDRGLEAVAYAYAEMTRHPAEATWEKPQGKRPTLVMDKTFHVVPRGIGAVIACCTFPTWNGYPGLFASLVTGNPVVVKPHPRAILPLAITVRIAREVLGAAGFDPNLVCLAPETAGERLASRLATHPDIRIIDFTGSSTYGEWLEHNAHQAAVFTEKAGVNSIVIDSTDDFAGMCANIAFSLSLYSGQMCTAPQNIYVPTAGIATAAGWKGFDEVAQGIADAVDALLADAARAVDITGAIVNDAVRDRVERAPSLGKVILAARELEHPHFPAAVIRTPVIVRLESGDEDIYAREHFGPVSFVIAAGDTSQSLETVRRITRERGALTLSVYTTDETLLAAALGVAMDGAVPLSTNLTDGVYVNQSAAFSDFHATGANPAANATLTDAAFVAPRFRVVQSRRHRSGERRMTGANPGSTAE